MRVRVSSIGVAFATFLLVACGDAPIVNESDRAGADGAELEAVPVMGPQRNVLAFGNSLFAGYGVDKSDSYPAKLEAALRAQGINARVANAGVSGDTTAAGMQRIEFTLNAQGETPDLAIVELGGNDLLRGLSPDQTEANLRAILDALKERDIPVLLMGMLAPPNYGPDYQRQFDAIYPALAKEYDADLVPFFLEAVYDKPELIQADRIHPTEEGIETLVASTSAVVVEALE